MNKQQPEGTISIFDVTNCLESSYHRTLELMKKMERDDSDPKSRASITAEIRQHIALAERTLKGATRAEPVNYFVDSDYEAVKTLSPTSLRNFALAMEKRHSELYRHKAKLERIELNKRYMSARAPESPNIT